MNKWFSFLVRQIVGRVKIIIMSNWFLTFGAMALPVGFVLLTISMSLPTAPRLLYVLGWVAGAIGLIAFFVALGLAYNEVQERKKANKKADENFRSVMKTIEAIRGELSGLRGDAKKWKQK